MDTKRLIVAAGVISLITLTGAGCSKSIIKSNNTANNSNNQNENSFDSSINLEIPDGEAKVYGDRAQDLVESVFGKVKITSFMQNFPAQGGMSMEYTANRNVTAGDINSLSKAVKDAGYTIEISGINDGSGAIISHNNKDTLMFTFRVGEPKIGTIVGPKDDFNTGDEYTSS